MITPQIKYSDFLINQKEPDYNSLEYYDFWVKHLTYCKSGVFVGGVFISGWLYYHINFFVIARDVKDKYGNNDRPIMSPKFRDNEFILDYYIRKAEESKIPLMIFGSRRFAKSAFLASRLLYRTTIFHNARTLLIGANSGDIKEVEKYINENIENPKKPFEKLKANGNLSKGEISFAFIDKSQQDYIRGAIVSKNVEAGKSRKALSVAGVTPSEVAFDEVGKYHFNDIFKNLLPALSTDLGEMRCSTIFTGTGGEVSLSADAEKIFLNSSKNGFLSVNFEDLKKEIKGFDFRQISDSDIGLFVPGQMSLIGGEKKIMPLSDFYNRDFTKSELKDLEGFDIHTTDWEKATKIIDDYIDFQTSISDKEGQMAEMAFPKQPEDCFKHNDNSDYNNSELSLAIRDIEDKGFYGEPVFFNRKNGIVIKEKSDKKYCDKFPFGGGVFDAPIMMYEDRKWDNPAYGTYIGGFDLYKTATSNTTTSLAVCYIMRRDGAMNKLVASYATRPSVPEYLYEQVEMMLTYYNATCMCEKEDMLPFEKYMQRKNKLHLLAKGLALTRTLNPKSLIAGEYGFSATPSKNKQLLSSSSINYVNGVHEVYRDNDDLLTMVGARFIPDIMLLKELREWGKHKNYDRKSAFEQCLVLAYDMDTNNVIPKNINANESQSSTSHNGQVASLRMKNTNKLIIKKRF